MTAVPSPPRERIAIGRIVRPVGVRGELKVIPLTDDPDRFGASDDITVGSRPEEAMTVRIERSRKQVNAIVVKLAAVDSIEAAERFRDQYMFVEAGEVRPPQTGTYLIDEIIGCTVVTVSGREVGTVADVMTLPANDVWVVRDGTKEHLLPAVRALLRTVDVARKRIEVEDLEGLFE